MQIYFTEHARKRMKQRYITTNDVITTLQNGVCEHSQDNLKYTYNNFIIITNKHDNNTIVIISAYYSAKFNKQCEKLAKKLKISYRQAIKIMREKEG
jgi:hypothetical protein